MKITEDTTSSKHPIITSTPVITSIELLPNWWFALACACYLGSEEESRRRQYHHHNHSSHHTSESEEDEDDEEEEEDGKKGDDSNNTPLQKLCRSFYSMEHAHFFLLQAILTWPQFYLGILQAMKVQSTPSLSREMIQRIDMITSHSIFQPFLTTFR